jgi:hypothetical protein
VAEGQAKRSKLAGNTTLLHLAATH